jgi:hypothetical protein
MCNFQIRREILPKRRRTGFSGGLILRPHAPAIIVLLFIPKTEVEQMRSAMDCGGKRSAIPLWARSV